MDRVMSRALEIALSQEGVRELGRNRGQRVEEYQASAGAHAGDAWCASFVVHCFRRAAAEFGVPCPVPVTPSALALWRRSRPQYHRSVPSVGSVFIINHGGGLGHCGFVEAVADDGTLGTVEGNTGPGPAVAAADREGDGVYRRTDRKVSDVNVGFIDVSMVS